MNNYTQEYETGKYYQIPHVRATWHGIGRKNNLTCEGFKIEWLPIIGHLHQDKEHLDFGYMHWHLDYRFVSKRLINRQGLRRIFTSPIMAVNLQPIGFEDLYRNQRWKGNSWSKGGGETDRRPSSDIPLELWYREKKSLCKRQYEHLPEVDRMFERALCKHFANCKIDPAKPVCPHKGFDLSNVPVIGGNITCPLHRLSFNAVTGKMVRLAA